MQKSENSDDQYVFIRHLSAISELKKRNNLTGSRFRYSQYYRNQMKNEIEIRVANEDDIELIRRIAFEVWPVAYNSIISKEQIEYMLAMMYSPESLLNQMQNEGCEFLIIEEDGLAVGFSSSARLAESVFKLHKLYVLSSMHGKGYGRSLLNQVCKRAADRGGVSIELQVNKNNPAFQFYIRNGFTKDLEMVFDIGNGFVMDDFILTKSLA